MADDIGDKFAAAQQVYAYLHGFQMSLSGSLAEIVDAVSGEALEERYVFTGRSDSRGRQTVSMWQNPNSKDRWTWDWFPL